MSLKESAVIELDYPILDAKFINNKTVLAIGGGGEGNNGVPNKITAVRCSFKAKDPGRKLQKFREITLPSNEDSPQCLDIANITGDDENKFSVFIGCNQSSQLIKSMNINNNLRKYVYTSDEHLRFLDAAQLEQDLSGDVDDYPKIIRLSSNNSIGCLMTASFPSMIYIFNPDTLDLNFRYKPSVDIEIKDFCLSPDDDGKILCYVTGNSIETVSTITGNSISSSNNEKESKKELVNFILSKVKFIDNENVVVAATSRKDKSISIFQYCITNMKLVKQKVITKKFNAVVALDISKSQDLICIAGNDLSVSILKLSSLKTIKVFKKLHPFAITSVSFSPNGSKLATCSAAKSLRIFKIPLNYSKSKSIIGTLFQYLISMVLVALLSILIQRGYENGQLFEYYEVTKHYGKIGFDLTSKYGQLGVAFIKEKFQQENIEGTEETKQYFQMTEWDTSSQDSITSDMHAETTTVNTVSSSSEVAKSPKIQKSEQLEISSKSETRLNKNGNASHIKTTRSKKPLNKNHTSNVKPESDKNESSKTTDMTSERPNVSSVVVTNKNSRSTPPLSKKRSKSSKSTKVQNKASKSNIEDILNSETIYTLPTTSVEKVQNSVPTADIENHMDEDEQENVKDSSEYGVKENAIYKKPVEENPIKEDSIKEPPIKEVSIQEESVEDTVKEAPVEEELVEEAPVEEELVEDTVKEAPVEEELVEEELVEEELFEDTVKEAPVEEELVKEEFIEEELIEEEPIEEEPIEEEPIEKDPVEEELVEEAPVEEELVEDTVKEAHVEELVEGVPVGQEPVKEVPDKEEQEPLKEEIIEDHVEEVSINEAPIESYYVEEDPVEEVSIDEAPIKSEYVEEPAGKEVVEELPLEDEIIEEDLVEEVSIEKETIKEKSNNEYPLESESVGGAVAEEPEPIEEPVEEGLYEDIEENVATNIYDDAELVTSEKVEDTRIVGNNKDQEDSIVYNHNLDDFIEDYKDGSDDEPIDLGTSNFEESPEELDRMNNINSIDVTEDAQRSTDVYSRVPRYTTKAENNYHDEL